LQRQNRRMMDHSYEHSHPRACNGPIWLDGSKG
jgi:hypothetical protein